MSDAGEVWFFTYNPKQRLVVLRARVESEDGSIIGDARSEIRATDRPVIKGISFRLLARLRAGSFVIENGVGRILTSAVEARGDA